MKPTPEQVARAREWLAHHRIEKMGAAVPNLAALLAAEHARGFAAGVERAAGVIEGDLTPSIAYAEPWRELMANNVRALKPEGGE